MTVYSPDAIETAVIDLLEGRIGATRVVAQGVLKDGVFEDQEDAAQQANALNQGFAENRFDVVQGDLQDSQFSPLSANGNMRIADLPITVACTRTFGCAIVEVDERKRAKNAFRVDLEHAAQALGMPHNLDETEDDVATGIIGGSLEGPDGRSTTPRVGAIVEDWDNQLMRAPITGLARLQIEQGV